MLVQLVVGAGASVCCITTHSFMMVAVLKVARSQTDFRAS
jgi:hypothetical protein